MLGYEEVEFIGKKFGDIFVVFLEIYCDEQYWVEWAVLEVVIYEQQFMCKDGNVIWAIVSSMFIFDWWGQLKGYIGIYYDIIECK